MTAVLLILVAWACFGAVGGAIGDTKGRQTAGVLLGLFLGVIGWVIIAVMNPTEEWRASHPTEDADQRTL